MLMPVDVRCVHSAWPTRSVYSVDYWPEYSNTALQAPTTRPAQRYHMTSSDDDTLGQGTFGT